MLTFGEICLFLIIGLTVSLDVAGLTAVRSPTYVGTISGILRWAGQNAFWHAILLLLYGAVTVAVADWALPAFLAELIERLREWKAPQWATVIVNEVANHILVGFATATIIIVWRAYAKKIVENPYDVRAENQGVERNVVRWILRALHLPDDFIESQIQSVAVALDMLALAFLLRSLQMFDAGALEDSYVRIAAIASLIFLSVFVVTTLTAIIIRRSFRQLLSKARVSEPEALENLIDLLKLMRLVEPLLIFYFLCEMMSFTVWRHASSSSLLFAGAALLLVALIKQVRFTAIDRAARDMVAQLVKEGQE